MDDRGTLVEIERDARFIRRALGGGHVAVALAWLPALLILRDQAPTWIGSTWLRFSWESVPEKLAAEADVMIVLGSHNSSNSLRLVEVAQRANTPAHLADDATEILPEWLEGRSRIGLTAGASAPPHLVDEVVAMLQALGSVEITERVHTTETISFSLPKEVTD